MSFNSPLTPLVQARYQPGNIRIPASKRRHLLQWNVATPTAISPTSSSPLLVLNLNVSLLVSFEGFSLTVVFFFLSFVPALKRLSLGLLFLVTYTLSSLYVSDDYLISDDFMVRIHLVVQECGRIPFLWWALEVQEWIFFLALPQFKNKSAISGKAFRE